MSLTVNGDMIVVRSDDLEEFKKMVERAQAFRAKLVKRGGGK